MKLARITNPLFQQALNKLAMQPLPLRVAFRLKGITAKVKEEFLKFEEARRAGLQKFGKKGEDGQLLLENDNVQFDQEGLEGFVKELGDLQAVEVEVGQIKLSELGDNVEMSVEELMHLEDLIVDG